MRLPNPPQDYSSSIERERNRAIESADALNLKKLQDVEFVEGARLILRSPNGTRYSITVSNLGVITATSI
jgi:hypothetical protein